MQCNTGLADASISPLYSLECLASQREKRASSDKDAEPPFEMMRWLPDYLPWSVEGHSDSELLKFALTIAEKRVPEPKQCSVAVCRGEPIQ